MKANVIGYERFKDKKGNENIRYYCTMQRNHVTGLMPVSVNVWSWQLERDSRLSQICIGDSVNFEFGPDGFLVDFENFGPCK